MSCCCRAACRSRLAAPRPDSETGGSRPGAWARRRRPHAGCREPLAHGCLVAADLGIAFRSTAPRRPRSHASPSAPRSYGRAPSAGRLRHRPRSSPCPPQRHRRGRYPPVSATLASLSHYRRQGRINECIVNLDYMDQYNAMTNELLEFTGSIATSGVLGRHALRLRQPRPAALRGSRWPARAALSRRRHRAAEATARRRPQGRIDRRPRARFRHAGARIVPHPDRERPSLLPWPRCRRAGAHRLARGSGSALVGLR